MNPAAAATRIIWESFVYRLKKREMNSLPAALPMMVALAMPWDDIVFRTLYLLVLNVYVYLFNDYFDIEIDLASPQKDQRKARFMADNRGASKLALFGLGAALFVAAALHSSLMVWAFIINTFVIIVYSRWLKRMPIVDAIAMVGWGASMQLVAIDGSPLSWKLVGFLALLCSSFEIIQVVRDAPEDREAGIVTTGVLLGTRRSAMIFRAILVASAAYGWLVLGSPFALGLLAGLALPLTPATANRTWDLTRVLYGIVWLAILLQVYFQRAV